jgi:hypothetical protein
LTLDCLGPRCGGPACHEGKGAVARLPPLPNRTCGFPAYGSPPGQPFRAGGTSCSKAGGQFGSREARDHRYGPRLPRSTTTTPVWLAPDDGRRATRLRFLPRVLPLGALALRLGLRGGVLRLVAERPPHRAYTILPRALAHASLDLPSWLRPLRSARLSPGIITTMSRSDPSLAPRRSASPLTPRFRQGYRASSEQTRSPSVTHVSLPTIPAPNT